MRREIQYLLIIVSFAALATLRVQRIVIDEGPGVRTENRWKILLVGMDGRFRFKLPEDPNFEKAYFQVTEYAPQKLWGLRGVLRQSGTVKLVQQTVHPDSSVGE